MTNIIPGPIFYDQYFYIINSENYIYDSSLNFSEFSSSNTNNFLVFKFVNNPNLNDLLGYSNVVKQETTTEQFNTTSPTSTYEYELGTGYIDNNPPKVGQSFFNIDPYGNLTPINDIQSLKINYINYNLYNNFNNVLTNTGSYQEYNLYNLPLNTETKYLGYNSVNISTNINTNATSELSDIYIYCVNNNEYLNYDNTTNTVYFSNYGIVFTFTQDSGNFIIYNTNYYNSILQSFQNYFISPAIFGPNFPIQFYPVILFKFNDEDIFNTFYFENGYTNSLNYLNNNAQSFTINENPINTNLLSNPNCSENQYFNIDYECVNYPIINYQNNSYIYPKNPSIISKKNIYILVSFAGIILLLILIIYIVKKL